MIRSVISYTCSRKCEMNTIAIPRSLSRAHQREELRDLVLVEARRRLVEDEHLAPRCRSRARSRPSAGRRASARRAALETSTSTPTRASASAARRRTARHWMRPKPARLAADRDVLGDREVRAEVDLLVDRAHPGALRLERMRELDARPVELDLARIAGSTRRSAPSSACSCRRRSRPSARGPHPGSRRKSTASSAFVPPNGLSMPRIWRTGVLMVSGCPATLPGEKEDGNPR